MNDEIKEILGNLKEWSVDGNLYFEINDEKAKKLYNYITNLQQEVRINNDLIPYFKNRVKELKKEITNLQKAIKDTKDTADDMLYELKQENENLKCIISSVKEDYLTEHNELEDYKSRCEKASEYNNQIIKDTKDFYRPTADIIYSGDCLIDIATNNINILQNGGD